MDCLFCKIVVGEVPCHKVYEDENTLAFLDIYPCANGHTVVIPKCHYNDLVEVGQEELGQLARGVQNALKRVYSALNVSSANIGINNGLEAGQAIPHLHWHIIPRSEKDGGGSMHSIVKKSGIIDVAQTAKLFL